MALSEVMRIQQVACRWVKIFQKQGPNCTKWCRDCLPTVKHGHISRNPEIGNPESTGFPTPKKRAWNIPYLGPWSAGCIDWVSFRTEGPLKRWTISAMTLARSSSQGTFHPYESNLWPTKEPLAGSRRQEYGCRVATQHCTSDEPGLAQALRGPILLCRFPHGLLFQALSSYLGPRCFIPIVPWLPPGDRSVIFLSIENRFPDFEIKVTIKEWKKRHCGAWPNLAWCCL